MANRKRRRPADTRAAYEFEGRDLILMRRTILTLAALLPLVAAATEIERPPLTGAQLMETPQCRCYAQCKLMWEAAPDAIQDASSMKVRFSNETMIDTFVPGRIGLLHGLATKVLNGYGGYIFVAEFDSRFEPPASYKTAVIVFNVELNTAGSGGCAPVPGYRKNPAQ